MFDNIRKSLVESLNCRKFAVETSFNLFYLKYCTYLETRLPGNLRKLLGKILFLVKWAANL